MSPVNLAELPPEVQAKIMKTMTVSDKLSPTLAVEMNQLAVVVIDGIKNFAGILPQITTLKEYFDTAERDSTNRLRYPVMSCSTWKEFCETHLQASIRTIQRLLRDVNKKPDESPAKPDSGDDTHKSQKDEEQATKQELRDCFGECTWAVQIRESVTSKYDDSLSKRYDIKFIELQPDQVLCIGAACKQYAEADGEKRQMKEMEVSR